MPQKQVRYSLGDPEDYNPITLSRLPESELRAEYTRLRRTARERLRRIERSSDFGDSPIATNNRAWLDVSPSEIPAADLPSVLSHVESLLEAKTGTLSGLRRQRALSIASLKESGIRGINRQNYSDYVKFMNQTQIYKEAYVPYPKRSKGSEVRDTAKQTRPKMFLLTKNGNISQAAIMREFQFFRDNLSKIEKLVRNGTIDTERKRSYSANEIRKMLGMNPEPLKTLKQAREEARALAPSKPKKGKRKGKRK